MRIFLVGVGAFALVCCATPSNAGRVTVSLDGQWQIADTQAADTPPENYTHTAPVPGLANLARPGFEKVDAFYSREHLANRIRAKLAPEEWLTNYWSGKVEQEVNSDSADVVRLLPTLELGFKGRYWDAKAGSKRHVRSPHVFRRARW